MRELQVLLAPGAELTQHYIMRFHAMRDYFADGHVNSARLPALRRVGRRFQGDALCVIAVFDIEGTRFADDVGDLIGHALIIVVWWNDIDIASGREHAFRRIRQNGQDGGGADDEDFRQSETLADFQDDVLQLTPARVESKIRCRSAGETNALKGDSLRNTSATSEDSVMTRTTSTKGPCKSSCQRSW